MKKVFLIIIFVLMGMIIFFSYVNAQPVSYQITSDVDDSSSYGSTHKNDMSYWEFGHRWGNDYYTYLRWSVDIPSGATINNAYLNLSASADQSGSFTANIELIDDDDCPDVENNNPINWETIGGVTWVVNDWVTDNWYTSSDISQIVQTFIDRAGYSPGNHICIRIRHVDANEEIRWGRDRQSNINPAILTVDWTSEPGTTSTTTSSTSTSIPGTTTSTTTTSGTTTSSLTSTTTTIPVGQFAISGRLMDINSQPVDADVLLYNQGTNQINTSDTTADGNYALSFWSGVYDLQYSILDFFIKLISFDIFSNLQNVVNYVTISEDKVSFTVDITGDQEIQVYSEREPETVKVNGTEMTRVNSIPNSVNEWYYDGQILHLIANPNLPTTTTTTTTTTTSISSTTTTSMTTTTTPLPTGMFNYRIADFMPVRVTQPNMDDPLPLSWWQQALDDLVAASPNGEITHVQLRGYWHCRYNSGIEGEPTYEEWETPMLGSTDGQSYGGSQWEVMQNWRSWYFCNPRPQNGAGLCAVERIRNAGFKLEIGLSLAYRIEPNIPPAMRRNQRERNHPNWNGSKFIENYWNNALKPFAEEAAPWLEAGDIFFIGFENYQENIDHLQLHSAEYSNMIAQLRTILPPGVLISDHTSSWYVGSGEEDSFLGLNQDGTIRAEGGLLNHYYFADLDLLEMSNWNPWVTTSQLPTDRNEVAQGHFNNPNACQRGTGYGGVPCVTGRNIMDDFQRIYDEFGTTILMNTGYQNCYGQAASNVGSCLGGRDENEQAEAWAGRLLALKMAIEQGYTWVAGQDFERYCEDISGDYTTYPVASWRNRPAQDEIINGIRSITDI